MRTSRDDVSPLFLPRVSAVTKGKFSLPHFSVTASAVVAKGNERFCFFVDGSCISLQLRCAVAIHVFAISVATDPDWLYQESLGHVHSRRLVP